MAIAAPTTVNSFTDTGTTATHSITVAAGTKLVVGIGYGNASDFITSIVFNGNALTRDKYKTEGTEASCAIYSILNELATTGNLVITLNTTATFYTVSADYPLAGKTDATGEGSGNSTSPSGSVTSVTDNAWGVMMMANNGGADPGTTVSGGVARANGAGYGFYDTNAPKTPAGGITINGITIANARWATALIAIMPAQVATASDSNVTTESVNYGITADYSDSNVTTDSLEFADWENASKSSSSGWSNQSKS